MVAPRAHAAEDNAERSTRRAHRGHAGSSFLVRCLDFVRAISGPKSHEHKQSVLRSASPADSEDLRVLEARRLVDAVRARNARGRGGLAAAADSSDASTGTCDPWI